MDADLTPAEPHFGIQQVLAATHASILGNKEGALARYIPELAAADPEKFGIAIATVDGKLYTCLFATSGIDLREALRSGADDDALRHIIADRWKRRDDRYSELRGLGIAAGERIEMSYIGG